jgi:hypothetical protein
MRASSLSRFLASSLNSTRVSAWVGLRRQRPLASSAPSSFFASTRVFQ